MNSFNFYSLHLVLWKLKSADIKLFALNVVQMPANKKNIIQ